MRVRDPIELGMAIRERRRALGLDQATLAARAGVSRQWLVAVERGKPRAESGLVMRLLNTVGLVVDLRTEEDVMASSPIPVVDIDAVIERASRRAP